MLSLRPQWSYYRQVIGDFAWLLLWIGVSALCSSTSLYAGAWSPTWLTVSSIAACVATGVTLLIIAVAARDEVPIGGLLGLAFVDVGVPVMLGWAVRHLGELFRETGIGLHLLWLPLCTAFFAAAIFLTYIVDIVYVCAGTSRCFG